MIAVHVYVSVQNVFWHRRQLWVCRQNVPPRLALFPGARAF